MKDITTLRETTPTNAERPTNIEEATAEMNREFYEAHTRETIVGERTAAMQGKGVFIPRHWFDVLDGDAAAYLAHFAHYEGTQSRTDGFVSDSNDDIREKVGKRFTNHIQGRIRRDLRRLGLAEFKPGWGRVTMVRPNVRMLKAWKEHGDYDEAVFALLEGRHSDTESAPLSNGKRVTVTRKALHSDTESAPLNTVTPVTHSNSLSDAHAQPEPEREGREEKEDIPEKIKESVAVLADIGGMNADARFLARLVSDLTEKHPRVDPVEVCKSYRDYVAGMSEPVKSHPALLSKFFEREAGRIESQPPNPHGPEAERLKDKPMRADWYEAVHGGSVEEYERMIRGGLTHTEIVESIERRAA